MSKTTSTKRLRVTYNAPVTLTFALLAVMVLLCNDKLFGGHLVQALFIAPSRQGTPTAFNWKSMIDYIRLFTHVLGHADWTHLFSNLSFILLLGPLLEERYGHRMLLLMITITALVTGVINACFLPTGLLGASGIACMMILLASFTSMSDKEIPLTFILIAIIYFGREIVSADASSNIATFAHIIGGVCGSIFGFFIPAKKRTSSRSTKMRSRKTIVQEELPLQGEA
ncbi:MAG: rhomboid family intramembrane serine protease [Treponema sp.]|nr:rhomboid family intramembrane serine protease [Treponema sp.]